MTRPNLQVALVCCVDQQKDLSKTTKKIFPVDSLKELVRLLIDTPIDLIVIDKKVYEPQSLGKIYKKYGVPFFVIGQEVLADHMILGSILKGCVSDEITKIFDKIRLNQVKRENTTLIKLHQQLTSFTNQVIHTSKDSFISETKTFFKETIKTQRCHWVEVKETPVKLPPILKLRQELKKQKVDQSSLINELNNCKVEVGHGDCYEIWETQPGECLALLWIPGPEDCSQFIVLSRVKTDSRIHLQKFIGLIIPFLKRRWDLCLTVDEAQQQIYRDSLTDLYNQKFLNDVLDKKMEEHKRYKTPFSILFIDVDHFKRVNDSLGHLVGSGVLAQVGNLLTGQIRNSDYAFRYGGDEFIVLLSHTEGDDAFGVAERIRQEIEAQQFEVNGVKVKITVSIGLAFYPQHAQSAQEIIKIADEAMYYGKNKSRNIVYKAS